MGQWVIGLGALLVMGTLPAGCTGEVSDAAGRDSGVGTDSGRGTADTGVDPTRPAFAQCDNPDDPYEPVQAFVYGTKIKGLLTGLPLTGEELDALMADPNAIRGQIDGWMDLRVAQEKLRRFLQTSFQQDGYEGQALVDLWGYGNFQMGRLEDRTDVGPLFIRTFEESFSRTAYDIVDSDRPFTEVLTTQTYYMTTAQMVGLALSDDRGIDDENDKAYQTLGAMIDQVEFQSTDPTTLAQSLNPSSPEWMRFYVENTDITCGAAGHVKTSGDLVRTAFGALFGFYQDNDDCRVDVVRQAPLLDEGDFFDWRPVTIRAPRSGEDTTAFYQVGAIRASSELVLRVPRVGFMTTPAFFATWPTNDANQNRVTTNQTLVVALGKSFDSETSIVPAFDDALDDAHADPTTSCWGCHVNLDPMRQYFRNSYSFYYHLQEDPEVRALRPAFAFQGHEVAGDPGDGVIELAAALADHPRFAPAWVQKACFYANGAKCPEDSAEFIRIVTAFRDSSMSFRTMFVELLASPLVTGVSCVEGSAADLASIARARHLCATLSNRLALPDACGTNGYFRSELGGYRGIAGQLTQVIPDDSFSRGGEDPIVIRDTNLFIRSAAEALCERIATELVKTDGRFPSSDPEGAIDFFVNDLMGLSASDPRRDPAIAILNRHYADAIEAEASTTNALRSTFIVACTSPTVLGMGL